jgi:hypothetical protein
MGTLEGEGYRTSRAPQNGLKGAEIAGELAHESNREDKDEV